VEAVVSALRAAGIESFLRRAGVPEIVAADMLSCARSLDPESLFSLMQSTFISYGGPDEAFARRLNDELFANGVATFFFAKDAEPGKKLHAVMRDGVNSYDGLPESARRTERDSGDAGPRGA